MRLVVRAALRSSTLLPSSFSSHQRGLATMNSATLWRSAHQHEIFTQPLQRSPNDDRDYRLIRLNNGLHALLIHDAKADKAAASLAVSVGHLSDPDDMPGLAHFCEHLLFMGTEQFPRENEYGDYISSHGGRTNAYTAASDTNYYFSVGADHLPGALQLFSGFFHSPLFSSSCTSRELHAVDSEHKKNLQSDSWRLFQMSKSLSKPGHVWSKFGSGNMLSLTAAAKAASALERRSASTTDGLAPSNSVTPLTSRMPSPVPSFASETDADGGSVGRETRRRLVEWWETHYCPTRMNLVVLGKECFDDLAALVVENFSPIVNRGLAPVKPIPELPWGPDQVGTIIHAKTIMDFQAVELQFQLPAQTYHWRSKPAHFLAHLLGHEGPGSLHSYLKQKGFLVRLSCGNQPQARGIDFFKLTCFLTPTGFKQYREVVLIMCKYLNMLRETQSFPAYLFDELQTLALTRFNYSEKRASDSYASSLSETMANPYPPDLLLSAGSLLWDWDEAHVHRTLAEFVPEKGRVIVMGKDYTGFGFDETKWDAEKWYKTQYYIQQLDEQFLEASRRPNDIPELFLPPRNEFIPQDLSVAKREVATPALRPEMIRKTALSTLWHKKDDQFWVPKANVILFMRSPLAGITPRHLVLTRLFCELVTDSLTEYAYAAELASLRYNVAADTYGLQIMLSGYNDKLSILLATVLHKLKTINIDKQRFRDIKEDVRQEYVNFDMSQPVEIADYYLRYTLAHVMWTPKERLAELTDITPEDLERHARDLLSRTYLDVLVHGNISHEQAISIMETTETSLAAKPLSESELASNRSYILPPGANFVHRQRVPNIENGNSGLSYYLHVGELTDEHHRAQLSLLAHLIHEPCFDVLRTKEQLGYIAQSIMLTRTGIMGLRLHVQSERSPVYLEQRVDAFLQGFQAYLEGMSEADFDKQKKGLITKKLEKTKSLSEEGNRIWGAISSGYQDFTRREIDAENVRKLTRADMLKFYAEYFMPTSPKRRKLSVHLKGHPKVDALFSVAASNRFLSVLKLHGVPVNEDDYVASSAAQPPVTAVTAFWEQIFSGIETLSSTTAEEILKQIASLAQEHPVLPVEDAEPMPTGAQDIVNLAELKAGMLVSAAATPTPY
ncbi:Metalloenzyme, LuxS/M16 peptidase-like protein [Auriculariales sp. MPI-PUGE-AT-0066]|nr:Metalloenzyme, LuxS/M16 peptidase-like protein [Auriculariales sp. MPI-PUGE-AT-0066]